MRHCKSGLKLNMTSSHRAAMFRNMVTSLLKHDKIRTTTTRAKELRGWADHIISLAKRGDLHARRQALSVVREKNVVHKLFDEAAERFASMAGGYTRIVKVGRRPGDAAPMSIVELVAESSKKPEPKTVSEKGKKVAVKEADQAAAPPLDVKTAEVATHEAETESHKKDDVAIEPEIVEEKKDA
jgi:large subunit ribosomal protein L17